MTKKILIIGGAGYIGGLTTDYLTREGFEVLVYDNILYEDRYLKPVEFMYGDIRETSRIAELSRSFDVIILMAALVGDPACKVDGALTEAINFIAIKDLCKAIPKDKHIIFISTCSVYGIQEGILDENSPTNPLSSYAFTKLSAEKYVTDRNGTIFRLGTVFGLGDSFSRIRMDLVVNVLTMRAVLDGRIIINGGEQWRPIIAVIDIAEYITEAVKYNHPGTFILSKENVTIKSLGERVAKIIPETKIEYRDISFQDDRSYKVDNSKALTTFKYKPKVTVEDEVKRMSLIFKEHRIKNPEDSVYHNGIFLTKMKELKTLK